MIFVHIWGAEIWKTKKCLKQQEYEIIMQAILSVAHLCVVFLLVGVILLQRSEGGGFTSDANMSAGMMSNRSVANFLTRITAFLATAFFLLSIALAVISSKNEKGILGGDVNANGRASTVQELLGVPSSEGSSEQDSSSPQAPKTQ